MKTFVIAEKLGSALISRPLVGDLANIVRSETTDEDITFDFKGVEFATRSFLDEFYNRFIKGNKNKVTIINAPEDITQILGIVSKTQNSAVSAATIRTYKPKDIKELNDCFAALGI